MRCNTPSLSRRRLLQYLLGSAVILAASPLLSQAAHAADDKFVIQCTDATPAVSSSHYPGASRIILSNNLARPTGKAEDAAGQLIYLTGRITDEKCVPIANAIIDLWQTNPEGDYRFATREELLTPYPLFAGSGRAVTNNLGEYHFITLFPGTYGKNAPHIHLRVTHPDYSALDTTLYFKGDERNAHDPRFLGLKPRDRQLLQAETGLKNPDAAEEGLASVFNIVLKGDTPYRRY